MACMQKSSTAKTNDFGATHLGLSFEETLLVGADLRKMRLQLLDFSEAVFLGGSLRNAHLKLTR